MDENQKLSFSVEKGINELVVRNGEAAPIEKRFPVKLCGDIFSARNYIKAREQFNQAEKINTHIIIDKVRKTIDLKSNETSEYATEIHGALEMEPDLSSLSINGKKMYSHKELLDKLKFMGVYFKDREAHNSLIGNLMEFKARIEKDLVSSNTNKGQSEQSRKTNITLAETLNLKFVLVIPIFKGQNKMSFPVEICIDDTSAGVVFWLESVELKELEMTETERIFDEFKNAFKDFLIINK